MNSSLVLIIISSLIFISILGEVLFRKYKIPDVLFLIIFGIILGPLLNYVHVDLNNIVIAVFSALALSIVMFDSGIGLDLREIIKNTPSGFKLSVLNFIVLIAISVIFYYITKLLGYQFLDLKTTLLIASILGGTSGIVVVPLLNKLNISEKIKNLLFLESTITDSLTIVVTYSLTLYFTTKGNDFWTIFKNIASSFSISIVLGMIFLLLWTSIIDRFLHLKEVKNYKYLVIMASILIIYVLSNFLGGSAAITVFVFALLLGNLRNIVDLFGMELKHKIISKEIYLLNVQFSFLIKTFFFFLIGVLVSLDLKALIYSLIFLLLIILARAITVFLLFKRESLKEKLFITFFTPKGLAASILAIFVAKMFNNEFLVYVIFDIILFSILLASLAALIYEKLNSKNKNVPNLEILEDKKSEVQETKTS